jgi:hypothetical protein
MSRNNPLNKPYVSLLYYDLFVPFLSSSVYLVGERKIKKRPGERDKALRIKWETMNLCNINSQP